MTLKSQAQAEILTVFLNNDEHGEPVRYREKGGGEGDFKAYQAIVIREEQIGAEGSRDGTTYKSTLSVHMARDGTDGPLTCHEGDVIRIGNRPPVSTFPTDDDLYDSWKVTSIPRDDAFGMREIDVVKIQRREVSGEQYRNRR